MKYSIFWYSFFYIRHKVKYSLNRRRENRAELFFNIFLFFIFAIAGLIQYCDNQSLKLINLRFRPDLISQKQDFSLSYSRFYSMG